MLITKDYKFNPLNEALIDDIDNEIITKMFKEYGAGNGLDAALGGFDGNYEAYGTRKIIKFILRQTTHKITNLTLKYEEWDCNVYSMTYDDSITPECGENREFITCELVMENI